MSVLSASASASGSELLRGQPIFETERTGGISCEDDGMGVASGWAWESLSRRAEFPAEISVARWSIARESSPALRSPPDSSSRRRAISQFRPAMRPM
jgi:hypothetical protein